MTKPLRGVSESFKQRADSAAFYEAWVGAVLARKGLTTIHHPFEIDGKDHGQSWDLTLYRNVEPGHLKSVNVEVKSLSISFADVESYPFNDVLICSQNSWNRKWPGRDYTMRDFLLVSKPTGHIVWIPCMTAVTLGHEVLDSARNELYRAVKCAKSSLRSLAEFVEHVRGE
jgi:hypothetical protein